MGNTEGKIIAREFLFTSESVTEGHPDKIADQISDAVLDAYLEKDPYARVACETMVTTNTVYITGEISSLVELDIEKVARETVKEIGYTDEKYGINADTCRVYVNVDEQSKDIAGGVNIALESRNKEKEGLTGAGDQGMMFGYATNETDAYLPYPIYFAHKLAKQLTKYRRKLEEVAGHTEEPMLRPDGKTQVTVRYEEGKIKEIDTIVVSIQHSEKVTQEYIHYCILTNVIQEVIPVKYITENTKIYINPSGRFIIGGPQGDVGLTGRKIIVDTYGGWSRHGGGAFSGKDSTKVDRSASYLARYIAKNIVAAELANECEIQLAYAIGKAEPVSVYVNTFNTSNGVTDADLESAVTELFKLDPEGIILSLGLRNPVFKETAAYGHFGRDNFEWEKLDKVMELKNYFRRDENERK